MIKILAVTGIQCAGKTTFCEKMVDELTSQNGRRPILVSLGKFLRNMFGEDFLANTGYAAAPDVLDNLVQNIIFHAVTIGRNYERDVVLDGFPRKTGQLEWLVFSSIASTNKIPTSIIFVRPENDDTLTLRLSERQGEKTYINDRIKSESLVINSLHEKALELHNRGDVTPFNVVDHVSMGV